jgi:hypothetical protein
MKRTALSVGTIGVLIAALILLSTLLNSPTENAVSPLGNIKGIPFPKKTSTIVTEKLAHADIYLYESVLAKTAIITIKFTPHALEKLEMGLRENAFWLSYPKHLLYDRSKSEVSGEEAITTTVLIPLTDKFQETDQSLDVMFFATATFGTEEINEEAHDTTLWELHDMTVETKTTIPTWPHLQNYVQSLLRRERAL